MQFLKMHTIQSTPDKMLSSFATAGKGQWTLAGPLRDNFYVVQITNFDQIKGLNPMVENKIYLQLRISLKPIFPGAITQIMIHLLCEDEN